MAFQFLGMIAFAGATAGGCDLICQSVEMRVKRRTAAEVQESLRRHSMRTRPPAAPASPGPGPDASKEESFLESTLKQLNPRSFDWARTARYVVCPGLCAGVASYIELVGVLGQAEATDWGTVLGKTAFDCLLYYPILIAGGFTVNLVVLDGKDWDYLREKFRQDFLTTWLASLVLWVPVDIVLFRFVPVAAQVYVVKSIDIIALLGFSYFVNKHPYSELTVLHRHHHHSTSGGLHGEEDVGKEEEEGSDPSDAASPQVSTWEGDLGDSPGAAAAAATDKLSVRQPSKTKASTTADALTPTSKKTD